MLLAVADYGHRHSFSKAHGAASKPLVIDLYPSKPAIIMANQPVPNRVSESLLDGEEVLYIATQSRVVGQFENSDI